MKVKDLLSKYNGDFYIYEEIYNEYGNLVDVSCIAYHNGNYTKEIGNRKVKDFQAGSDFRTREPYINIYID